VFMKQGGKYYYYHNDHLGTPQVLTDRTGAIVWSADYDVFGRADVLVAAIENNLRFPGQYYDAETGLHYNWWRYYDPGVGRYVRTDPIGFDGGDWNLYGYVQLTPLVWSDQDGLVRSGRGFDVRRLQRQSGRSWGRSGRRRGHIPKIKPYRRKDRIDSIFDSIPKPDCVYWPVKRCKRKECWTTKYPTCEEGPWLTAPESNTVRCECVEWEITIPDECGTTK